MDKKVVHIYGAETDISKKYAAETFLKLQRGLVRDAGIFGHFFCRFFGRLVTAEVWRDVGFFTFLGCKSIVVFAGRVSYVHALAIVIVMAGSPPPRQPSTAATTTLYV